MQAGCRRFDPDRLHHATGGEKTYFEEIEEAACLQQKAAPDLVIIDKCR